VKRRKKQSFGDKSCYSRWLYFSNIPRGWGSSSANGGLYCGLDDILPLDLRLTAGLAGTSFACTDPEAGCGLVAYTKRA
jgi:hypothetical protein